MYKEIYIDWKAHPDEVREDINGLLKSHNIEIKAKETESDEFLFYIEQ